VRDPIAELTDLLARLPGVGERTATRLAFHVLGTEPDYAKALGEALTHIHDRVVRCETCGNYGAESVCAICRDPRRDSSVVCCVARVPDLVAIEKSATFRGRYHVLHGLLAPLDGVGPDDLPLDGLRARLEPEEIREVVVATPLSVEGEATALYVSQVLKPLGIRVSRIASGVPHGGELEFTDQVTLGRAFDGRREI
jgi:recombination protein RecR